MIKRIFLVAATLISFSAMISATEGIVPEPDDTYLFASRDTCNLYMDIYHPAEGSATELDGKEKPTILFMFGGGFIQGTRDDKSYNSWFRMLTENGYRVISNCGDDGCQSVHHLHFHILGGKKLPDQMG